MKQTIAVFVGLSFHNRLQKKQANARFILEKSFFHEKHEIFQKDTN